MARRRKSSTAKDFMDLVALLPWWAGIALALASYMALHAIAIRPLPAVQSAQQFGSLATSAIWQGLATAGQYTLPLLCLAGAAISAVRKRRRSQLLASTTTSAKADALQNMSWQEFEMLVVEGFLRRGYAVRENGGGGPDGGVDLVLSKDGDKVLVQCKQWKAFKVGVATVRELYGVMAADGAAAGIVVTSGKFTQDAEAFAAGRNIRLMNGDALMKLLREARVNAGASPRPRARHIEDFADTLPVEVPTVMMDYEQRAAVSHETECPQCEKGMVRRMAKRGATVGKAFWGSSGFGAGCRGTRGF